MQCLHCDKKISFAAEICPYCQRKTEGSVATHLLMMVLGLPLGYLGWEYFGFIWGVLGAVIGVVFALVVGHKIKNQEGKN